MYLQRFSIQPNTSQDWECKPLLLSGDCILKWQWLLKGITDQGTKKMNTVYIFWTLRKKLLQRQLAQWLTQVKWFYLCLQIWWDCSWNSAYSPHGSVFQILSKMGKCKERSYKIYLQAEETPLHRTSSACLHTKKNLVTWIKWSTFFPGEDIKAELF